MRPDRGTDAPRDLFARFMFGNGACLLGWGNDAARAELAATLAARALACPASNYGDAALGDLLRTHYVDGADAGFYLELAIDEALDATAHRAGPVSPPPPAALRAPTSPARGGGKEGGEAPRIVELRVQGAGRADKADMLAVIAALLGAHGFEPCPVDRALPCLDVILPADWRDLPIARAVLAGSPPPAALASSSSLPGLTRQSMRPASEAGSPGHAPAALPGDDEEDLR